MGDEIEEIDEAESLLSFRPRGVELVPTKYTELRPQHNRGEETRENVTQRDFYGGSGVIGSTKSLCYGHYQGKRACVVVFNFSFLWKGSSNRFLKAAIDITFEPYSKGSKSAAQNAPNPVVRIVSPGTVHGVPNSGGKTWLLNTEKQCDGELPHIRAPPPQSDTGQRLFDESHRLQIKGRRYAGKTGVRNKAGFVVEEICASGVTSLGILEDISCAILVECDGHFKAHVEVSTDVPLARQLRAYPWRSDDPVLFVHNGGVGAKLGNPVSTFKFEELSIRNWKDLVSDAEADPNLSEKQMEQMERAAVRRESAHTDPLYRVQGIPEALDSEGVRVLLKEKFHVDQAAEADPEIRSLAIDDRSAGEQTATIISPLLRNKLGQDIQRKVELSSGADDRATSRKRFLVLDDKFVGMTFLSAPETEPVVDIVCLSGLGAHSFASFKERGGSHMWLVDDLRHYFPDARLMTYGYNTQLQHSDSFQDLEAVATTFNTHLKSVRSGNTSKRPMIVIAHSLGGLVLKRALIRMVEGDEKDRATAESIIGILFFGVPNLGMNTSPLRGKVEGQPNEHFLHQLRPDSGDLRGLNQEFLETFTFKSCRIESFYETELSPTAKPVGNDWQMVGPKAIMVEVNSAIAASRSWENNPHHQHAIKKNHSELVKFYAKDPCCMQVMVVLQNLMGENRTNARGIGR